MIRFFFDGMCTAYLRFESIHGELVYREVLPRYRLVVHHIGPNDSAGFLPQPVKGQYRNSTRGRLRGRKRCDSPLLHPPGNLGRGAAPGQHVRHLYGSNGPRWRTELNRKHNHLDPLEPNWTGIQRVRFPLALPIFLFCSRHLPSLGAGRMSQNVTPVQVNITERLAC